MQKPLEHKSSEQHTQEEKATKSEFLEPKAPTTPSRARDSAQKSFRSNSSAKQYTPRIVQGANSLVPKSKPQGVTIAQLAPKQETKKDERQNGAPPAQGSSTHLSLFDGWPSPASTHLGAQLQSLRRMQDRSDYAMFSSPSVRGTQRLHSNMLAPKVNNQEHNQNTQKPSEISVKLQDNQEHEVASTEEQADKDLKEGYISQKIDLHDSNEHLGDFAAATASQDYEPTSVGQFWALSNRAGKCDVENCNECMMERMPVLQRMHPYYSQCNGQYFEMIPYPPTRQAYGHFEQYAPRNPSLGRAPMHTNPASIYRPQSSPRSRQQVMWPYGGSICPYGCADIQQCIMAQQQMIPPYAYPPGYMLSVYRNEEIYGYPYPVYPYGGFAVSQPNQYEGSPHHRYLPPAGAVPHGETENTANSWHQHSHSGKNRQQAVNNQEPTTADQNNLNVRDENQAKLQIPQPQIIKHSQMRSPSDEHHSHREKSCPSPRKLDFNQSNLQRAQIDTTKQKQIINSIVPEQDAGNSTPIQRTPRHDNQAKMKPSFMSQQLRKENLTEIASNHGEEDFGQMTQRSAIILRKREPLVEQEEEKFEMPEEIVEVQRFTPERMAEAMFQDEERLLPHELYKMQLDQAKQNQQQQADSLKPSNGRSTRMRQVGSKRPSQGEGASGLTKKHLELQDSNGRLKQLKTAFQEPLPFQSNFNNSNACDQSEADQINQLPPQVKSVRKGKVSKTTKTCKQSPNNAMLQSPDSNGHFTVGQFESAAQLQTEIVEHRQTVPEQRTSEFNQRRRGYIYNNGRPERVIRKRMRKNAGQLDMLNEEFESNPHWSKESLFMISQKTGLTEAQVYKWGWDQKRKKFGVETAMKMRQYENILDQQNEARINIPMFQKFADQIKQVTLVNSSLSLVQAAPEKTPDTAGRPASTNFTVLTQVQSGILPKQRNEESRDKSIDSDGQPSRKNAFELNYSMMTDKHRRDRQPTESSTAVKLRSFCASATPDAKVKQFQAGLNATQLGLSLEGSLQRSHLSKSDASQPCQAEDSPDLGQGKQNKRAEKVKQKEQAAMKRVLEQRDSQLQSQSEVSVNQKAHKVKRGRKSAAEKRQMEDHQQVGQSSVATRPRRTRGHEPFELTRREITERE